jgi:hypothetical protein
MVEKAQRANDSRLRPGVFVGRLVLVLAVVVVVVLLAKRAIALDRQLQAVLEAETRALNRGDRNAFEALQDPEDANFRRAQRSSFDSFLSARERGEVGAQPTLYVVEASRRGDEAWALLMENPDSDPVVGPAKIEFFRRVYGQWLHTGPDPDHWGPPQESRTEHITWTYREADASEVARLATVAEAFTQQVCDDLGFDLTPGAFDIEVCYSLDCGQVVYPLDEVLDLPTPLLFGFDQEGSDELLANLLVDYLVSRATGLGESARIPDPMMLSAIERWEVAQLTGESSLYAVPQAVAEGKLLTLEGLSSPRESDNLALRYEQAYTLVEYTVAQYGGQILPALLRTASHRADVSNMLKETLGADLDLAAFEAGWLDFVQERYGDGG